MERPTLVGYYENMSGARVLKTSRRDLTIERCLVMGILNVTPDSFSDGGQYLAADDALRRAEAMIAEGADIIDVGGESTRPGSGRVPADVEMNRVVSVIKAVTSRFDIPVSVDTSRSGTAKAAIDAGAEIVNDISGLRWDPELGSVAAEAKSAIILMHSRGEFAEMHSMPPVEEVVGEVIDSLKVSVAKALAAGVAESSIVVDIGIGFGKSRSQNFELLAKLDKIADSLPYPIVVGASRKSFLAEVTGEKPPEGRVAASTAAAVFAVMRGANVLRVHDVAETVEAVRTYERLASIG